VKGGPQVAPVPPQTFAAPPDQQAASEAQPNEPQEPGGQFGEQLSLELAVRGGDSESATTLRLDLESAIISDTLAAEYAGTQ